MKNRILAFFCSLFILAPWAAAQGKTDVLIMGKDKGSVASMQAGGHTLVDGAATAKKLGGTVEVFSASRQLKIAFPGMYAILGAPLKEAVINAKTVALPAEVVASGGKIYIPVQFFMLPQVQQAVDRQIAFEKRTLIVERNYNLSFASDEKGVTNGQLSLLRKEEVAFTAQQTNKHTVKVLFKDAVLKREIMQRPRNEFIRSFSLMQRGKDAELEVILAQSNAPWNITETGNTWIWQAAAVTPVMNAKQPAAKMEVSNPSQLTVDTLPGPTVIEENEMQAFSLSAQESGTRDEEAEELDLSAAAGPIMTAVSAPTPVMSAVPGPVIKAKDMLRIVIDPGHGGKDPGAVRKGSQREKELNLNVAKHLYTYLKKQGFDVKLTRSDDTFVTLAGRSKMANDFKADLFISVHTNAAKRSQANGFEVYFRSDKATDTEAAEVAAFENEALQYEETHYSFVDKLLQSLAKNEYMNESSTLAGHVRNAVYKEPGIGIAVNQNSSIKQANFYVLRGVQSPAILIEMGFISSPKDRSRLNNKSAQKHLGEGIGKGVVAYLKQEGKIK